MEVEQEDEEMELEVHRGGMEVYYKEEEGEQVEVKEKEV